MPEMGKVFHHVPQYRAVADGHHRFGNVVSVVAQSQSQATTEQHHLHASPRYAFNLHILDSAIVFPARANYRIAPFGILISRTAMLAPLSIPGLIQSKKAQ